MTFLQANHSKNKQTNWKINLKFIYIYLFILNCELKDAFVAPGDKAMWHNLTMVPGYLKAEKINNNRNII